MWGGDMRPARASMGGRRSAIAAEASVPAFTSAISERPIEQRQQQRVRRAKLAGKERRKAASLAARTAEKAGASELRQRRAAAFRGADQGPVGRGLGLAGQAERAQGKGLELLE